VEARRRLSLPLPDAGPVRQRSLRAAGEWDGWRRLLRRRGREPTKRAAKLRDKAGYYTDQLFVTSVITGGGSVLIPDSGVYDFVDTTGTHPDVDACQRALDDARAASQCPRRSSTRS
jgi:hypothetical protein